jgi:hypothetical protein
MEGPSLGTTRDSAQDCGAHDDTLSAAAIGSLAFVSATFAHEALGHGSYCLVLGGRVLVHPVSMQCTVASPILVAAGPLTNIVVGVALWIILTCFRPSSVHFHYFLWLTMAFNLFDATGYFCLGAITGFGDWGVLLTAVQLWWKVGLALLGGLLYYGCMHAVASSGYVFLGGTSSGVARGRRLTIAPYLAAGVVACAAALMTPLGRSYVWVAAAASFGAGLGLLAIHDWGGSRDQPNAEHVLMRSSGWLVASIAVSCLFIFVVGRGLPLAL